MKNIQDTNLSEIVSSGHLSANSVYYSYMKKYGIDKIRVYKEEIIGPALGMIKLIENEYASAKPKYVADFFAGSLAYSQVCTRLGAEKVDAYDLKLENHYKKNNSLILCEQNLLLFKIPNKYDLILVEPPRELHLPFLSMILQTPLDSIILFRLGFTKYVQHIDECISICKDFLLDTQWVKHVLFDEVYLKIYNRNVCNLSL